MADECKPVGRKARSERLSNKIEDIVSAAGDCG